MSPWSFSRVTVRPPTPRPSCSSSTINSILAGDEFIGLLQKAIGIRRTNEVEWKATELAVSATWCGNSVVHQPPNLVDQPCPSILVLVCRYSLERARLVFRKFGYVGGERAAQVSPKRHACSRR
jgi:hypothetical protein